ncbi:hypothetical protein AB5N19_07618 [Seiridium cardinale]
MSANNFVTQVPAPPVPRPSSRRSLVTAVVPCFSLLSYAALARPSVALNASEIDRVAILVSRILAIPTTSPVRHVWHDMWKEAQMRFSSLHEALPQAGKQEVRCTASKSNPWPDRPQLKCDEECLRLQRNARLAAALNIDPATHTDDHVPYSDTTLKFFRDNAKWAQTYEREFRVFASEPSEKRLRFKPMKSHQRAFLHSLAEDFGLDSESQDPEPHRHVSIFKTPRFVSAPAKTLAQCVKIRAADPSQSQQADGPNIVVPTELFNGLILSSPQFGLTIEELESALKADFATQPSISFTVSFLPSDEIVLKGSGAWTPQALELSVTALKPLITQTVTRQSFAKTVALCHVDSSLNVLRRETDTTKNAGGWSTVVGRSAARPMSAAPPAPTPARGKFIALLKPSKKNKVEEQPVEEDWEAAAEKLDEEEVE